MSSVVLMCKNRWSLPSGASFLKKKQSWRRVSNPHKRFCSYYKREAAEEGNALQSVSPNPALLNLIGFLKKDQKCPCPMVLQLDPQLVELRPCSCSEGVAASSIVPSLPGSGELLRGSFTPCSPSHSIGSGLGDAISILPWWWKMLVHGKILKPTVKGSNSVRQWKPASRYCQEPGEVFWEGNWSWPKRSLDY